MAVDLGLGHCRRAFAFQRPYEQKSHAGSSLVNQCSCFEQRRDSFVPGHSRYRDDHLGCAKTEYLAKQARRWARSRGLLETLDIDTGARDQLATAAANHAAALEEG